MKFLENFSKNSQTFLDILHIAEGQPEREIDRQRKRGKEAHYDCKGRISIFWNAITNMLYLYRRPAKLLAFLQV